MLPSMRKDIDTQFQSLPEKYRFPIPDHIYEPEKVPGCVSGMRGRMAVFEVLEMTPEIERIVLRNPVDSELWQAARAQGMLTMREDAMLKSFAKLVPYSEVATLSSTLVLSEQDDAANAPAPAAESGETIKEANQPVISLNDV